MRDDDVVFGDHRLWLEVHDLLAHVDEGAYAVDERRDDRQTGLERAVVAAEPLDDAGAGLRDHLDRSHGEDEREQHCDCEDDDEHDHCRFFFLSAGLRA